MAKAGGDVLTSIFGLPHWSSVIIVVGITALYTTFGGLRASVITDAFQFSAFAILLPLTLLWILFFHVSGGLATLAEQASAATSEGLNATPAIEIVALLAAFLLGETLIPPYANRALASKTTRVSRNGFVLAGCFSVAWFGVKWWRMLLAAAPSVVLALLVPKTPMILFAAGVIGFSIMTSTSKDETGEWFSSAWGLAKQILPLLFAGVIVAGLLLGSPDCADGGLIPAAWVAELVGGNSVSANLFAAVVGAFMYFATLTEVPILQGLIRNGMGEGPALALLLAGPALSLHNMLVIRSVMGTKKTVVFVLLVIVMASISGLLFGVLT